MTTIDLTVDKARRKNAIKRAKERNIVIPTYAQMKDPSKVPARIKTELKDIGLWDVDPRNLFRITWHNEPKSQRWWLRRGQLPRIAQQPDRRTGPHRRARRQVVPDRRSQGRCGL